jgi:hypothetical protein
MKSFSLFFSFLVFAWFWPLVGQAITLNEIKPACFEKRAEFYVSDKRDVLVEAQAHNGLFFVYGNELLSYKLQAQATKQYLDYQIISQAGLEKNQESELVKIKDNNNETHVDFNSLETAERSLEIDLGSVYPAGALSLFLNYEGGFLPKYELAIEPGAYRAVDRIDGFPFRYLRVRFEPKTESLATRRVLRMYYLSLVSEAAATYLVKPQAAGLIYAYSTYRCENNALVSRALQEIEKKNQDLNYSTDVNTERVRLTMVTNPDYDADPDNDGAVTGRDNCPFVANPDQSDLDFDLLGDACDPNNNNKDGKERDTDGDTVPDSLDNCPSIINPKQTDSNADRAGDLCSDDDNDGIVGEKDNCISVFNPGQEDLNVNLVGDACEFDKDKDGIFDSLDNCISVSNRNQSDKDKDGIGDACDNCGLYNPQQLDKDASGIGDVCEEEKQLISDNDFDGDGLIFEADNCQHFANPDQADTDKDGVGDLCDNCLALQNSDQADEDNNGIGDLCDDSDGDGFAGYLDNCPSAANPDQKDSDNDGKGDACSDDDKDGVINASDNCRFERNRKQEDVDGDGIGDACDEHDDRFLESNRTLFVSIITIICLVFGALILLMFKKIHALPAPSQPETEKEKEPLEK